MKHCIKVLHIVPELNIGGIEKVLINYYNYIDRNRVQFDFIVHGHTVGAIEKKFIELGSNIYHITPKKESIKAYLAETNMVLKKNNYDIVHVHQSLVSFIPLYLSKKTGVKYRIAHSHGNNSKKHGARKCIDSIFSFLTRTYSNYYFACGLEAGKWVFGEKNVKKGKVTIIKNAINLEEYKFSKERRGYLRNNLHIEDKLVVSQVGRFTYEKNHDFTISILERLVRITPNVVVLFIGDGELKDTILSKVTEMHLENHVRFMGNCNNVNELLSAIDILLLPSLHEGLPLTPIESQANGLKCIVSSRVTDEIKLTDLIEFLDIESVEDWVKSIIQKSTPYERMDYQVALTDNGFEIKSAAKNLQNLYEYMVVLDK